MRNKTGLSSPAIEADLFEESMVGGTTALDSIDASTVPTYPVIGNDDSDWLLDAEMQRLRCSFNIPELTKPLLTSAHATGLNIAASDAASSMPENLGEPFSSITEERVPDSRMSATNGPQMQPATFRNTSSPASNSTPPKIRPMAIVAWLILALGIMAFSCGGVLLAWSFIGHRSDLWNLGMPFALAGQFGLLLGLVLHLDQLWHSNRRTVDTLESVDHRLAEINHATTLLQSAHSSPGKSFYVHLAENAHPHLLLADLKGQLDLLANKISQQR